MNYLLMRDNEQSGPFTMDQLKSMWSNGQITGRTLYWFDGLTDWLPIEGMVEDAIREDKVAQLREVKRQSLPASKKGWSSGAYAVLAVLTIIVPVAGFVFGLLGVFDEGKRKQAVSLIGLGILSILLYVAAYLIAGIVIF